ncbi:MAG: ATP-binding domain-containing protein, partial [Candidatus Methanomethylophilus sp.]|nr:ATP-binding domain-containing protein [Methanomethylophilus sp.]
ISTIHSAKGLEWDTVFIMGLCEGNFPNPYFCRSLPPDEQLEFFNNEWKKMYVAATRARKRLCLTYPSSITRKGYTFRKDPSRFLRGTTTSPTPQN